MAVKKKTFGQAYGTPRDISDLNVVVDEWEYARPQAYTWKGGQLVWHARFTSENNEDGTSSAVLSSIEEADYRPGNDLRFVARRHQATDQWLALTPAGYTLHDTPEEALDEMNRAYAGLPPERTSTITLTGVRLRAGVDSAIVATDLARFIRNSYMARTGRFTARQVKITEDGK